MTETSNTDNGGGNSQLAAIESIVLQYQDTPGGLMPALWAIQNSFGYIAPDWIAVIANGLNLSRAEVHGVISFYHDFKTQAAPDHRVQICRAEACQAMGGRKLQQAAQQVLGIGFDEVSDDNKVGLESVYCLGLCACGPAMMVNGELHGRVDQQKLQRLLASLTA